MKRITNRDKQGNVYIPECFSRCNGMGCSEKCNDCTVQDALINTLAAYEDTNLIPERIIEVDKLYLEKCEEVNRLNAELAELKKQLPPCSVGDIVYRINRGAKNPIIPLEVLCFKLFDRNLVENFKMECVDEWEGGYKYTRSDIGRSVFLTESEAKAALKRLESE